MTDTSETSSKNGSVKQASDELYAFMMEGIPYRYDTGSEPEFLTRAEAVASSDPAVQAEAKQAPQDGPRGMMFALRGPASDFGGQGKPRLTKAEEDDIKENRAQEGLWWHYDDKYYRVTKALRIPYVVYQDGGKTPVVKHSLVGYSGIDGAP